MFPVASQLVSFTRAWPVRSDLEKEWDLHQILNGILLHKKFLFFSFFFFPELEKPILPYCGHWRGSLRMLLIQLRPSHFIRK